MSELLTRKKYLVKEQVSLGRLHEVYDIFDPETGSSLGSAVENACPGTKLAKFFLDRDMIPFCVQITDNKGNSPVSICRGGGCWVPTNVKNSDGQVIASFHKHHISLGGKIDILDHDGREMGTITGDWSAKKYMLTDSGGRPQGEIVHLSGGLFKDHFTTADDYEVRLTGEDKFAPILLAAVFTIDMLYHEG